MSWLKQARKPTDDDVTFKVRVTKSFADTFEAMLRLLKNRADSGHSFSIEVDPEAPTSTKYDMDGDGSEHIVDIEREQTKEALILDFKDYDRQDQLKGDSGCFDENAPVDRKKKIAPDPGPASLNPGMADIAPQVFE